MKLKTVLFAVLVGLTLPSIAAAQSVDCAKPSSTVDRTVCASESLTELDVRVEQLYLQVLELNRANPSSTVRLRFSFSQQRKQCGDSSGESVRSCLDRIYVDYARALTAELPPKPSGAAPPPIEELSRPNIEPAAQPAALSTEPPTPEPSATANESRPNEVRSAQREKAGLVDSTETGLAPELPPSPGGTATRDLGDLLLLMVLILALAWFGAAMYAGGPLVSKCHARTLSVYSTETEIYLFSGAPVVCLLGVAWLWSGSGQQELAALSPVFAGTWLVAAAALAFLGGWLFGHWTRVNRLNAGIVWPAAVTVLCARAGVNVRVCVTFVFQMIAGFLALAGAMGVLSPRREKESGSDYRARVAQSAIMAAFGALASRNLAEKSESYVDFVLRR